MIRFQYRAWRILSVCEKLVGYWPYQNKMTNFPLRIFSASLMSLFVFVLTMRLVEEWNGNLHIVIENFIIIIPIVVVLIKVVTISTLDERRQKFFTQIATRCETIADKDEAAILRDSSEIGLIFTIRCTVLVASSFGIYMTMPMICMFSLYFFSHGTLEKKLPFFVDFLVDEQEYFFCILAYMFFTLMVGMVVDFTFDLNFFLTVRHICALFKIVKLRLDRASDISKHYDQNNKLSDEDEAKAYEMISSAVDLHNEASELAESLDDAYKISWFFILVLNAIALAPLPVMVMLYSHDMLESFRRSLYVIVCQLHFYIIFLHGQVTIDHSGSVFDNCYEFCWFTASKRCRLAISIMMSRSLKPSRLTGVLFNLSMQTYSVMLKTALSYISMFQALDL